MVRQHWFPTPLGLCRVDWQGDSLVAFRLPEEANDVVEFPLPPEARPAWVDTLIERVILHLSGSPQDFSALPYDFSEVTPFQAAVYRAALEVKPGQMETYGGLAKRSGYPISASRSVGAALGQNPWPLLVPCHRFVGASGKMVGFSAPGGIKTKLRLLALEGAELFGE